jgi:exodeoxyribonuclease V beta subunit
VWWKSGSGRTELDKYLRSVLAPGVGVQTTELGPIDELMQPANARILRLWIGDGSQFKRADSRLRSRLEALATFIDNGDRAADPPKDLADVLADPLDKHRRDHALPTVRNSVALEIAHRAAALLPALGNALRSSALARYRGQLREQRRRRLIESGAMTFDELIERVHDALLRNGNALADRLFAAWPVAMIDEFQDTDAQQYAILDRIYRAGEGNARGRLIMIGDPKQAIYRFRGGDIDSYLEASETATSTLALAVNHRSSRQYVAALNSFYARAGARLSSDAAHQIRYVPVRESDRRDGSPYAVDGVACGQPLQFHYWDAPEVPAGSNERVEAALDACADHIVELLSGRHAIGARRVQPGDIAVLLPTGRQIALLRTRLLARAVPCVSTAWSSVFESPWARELHVILYAALHPRDDGAVRAALATRLGGADYEQLRSLREQPDIWQRETEVFARLDGLWQSRGVLALIQQLTANAAARIFSGEEGERAMTDLRHLGELLQARSEEISGREELLTWLADERARAADVGDAAVDERQVRIESDAARVRLMTLHASKGLEFSIVMLPLMWANREYTRDAVAVVHDTQSRQRVVTFSDDGLRHYRQQGQDERYRLLYVALTRARYACHVYALSPQRPVQRGSTRSETDPVRAPLDAMLEQVLRAEASPVTMDNVLWSVGPWPWQPARYRPQQTSAASERQVLSEPPSPRFEATYSFSALAHGAAEAKVREDEAAADESLGSDAPAPVDILLTDETVPTPVVASETTESEHAELAWLAPIAGADFGNAVHAMLERRVVNRPMAQQHALIERCLLAEGVGLRGIALGQLVPYLAARVQATLDASLPSDGATLTLGGLPAQALCAEMPFEFQLGEVSLGRLREVCAFVPPTPLRTLRGLMSGKIDLVFEHAGRFHVLDYKTNRLGASTRLSDYAPAQLDRAMADNHYRFQALLYTLAIDRFLRQRVDGYRRSTHLGAAIYLFVRAVGIAPQSAPRAGIWTERFDDALLDAVDAALAADAREAA